MLLLFPAYSAPSASSAVRSWLWLRSAVPLCLGGRGQFRSVALSGACYGGYSGNGISVPIDSHDEGELMKINIRTFVPTAFLFVSIAGMALVPPQEQGAKQDMKDAGHATKEAAEDTGHATKKTAKRTGHAVKRTTKRAAHKVKRGAERVEDKTDRN